MHYEPDTLNNFRDSWQRKFDEIGRKDDLKLSKDFKRSRKVLASRRKQLTQLGKGGKPNACRPLEEEEVERLYESDFFGFSIPMTLTRTMWWKVSTLFGYRARDECRKLKFSDITLNVDSNGREYLEWDRERGTKTRTGENSYSHQRAFNPKAFAIEGSKCPVKTYKKFIKHRPKESKEKDSPFFLTVLGRPLKPRKLGLYLRPRAIFSRTALHNS